ncbi:UDP-N-acetylmuramoyl-L-alanyl-D-glutamate--2,6-diaminopimelate ligase [Arenicella xantha]|uniref:UDP-N-acetylmuramoyl-L-alanyl-D-glutamate--2,6-diaminopimelate ligase n=1 Tax=Arenicella xantha TaxID=644221 RepID=A0A395JKZ6_9GAMM|nr:UDP-N-acetylmuramoyl-L-alanyl-D-glutamate--2,6-diaminopimelate ligase [Arenicella xantha]RBP49861.1 UDP-N-acetylmuramoylalanyl-D-glutamate--2,6-diaminopimelate ligase [Arenicella xantha]
MSYSLPLAELLALLGVESSETLEITALSLDSRQIAAGSLFLAYPGANSDGRDFMLQAQAAGASAIIYDERDYSLPDAIAIPSFAVANLQAQVGVLADAFYAKPSAELQVFGVTGTNGKTTCCYLLTQALTQLGLQAAMIGTIGVGRLDALQKAGHTTPDPISLHRQLAEFRDQGITQVCMEVSSHALDQGRVSGVRFFCALFTNLSHDHLDYHGDMASYGRAKQRLFTQFHSELAIINVADSFGAQLRELGGAEFSVGYGAGGDVYLDDLEMNSSGMQFVVEGSGVEFAAETPLIGQVNVPNIELLVATLLGLSTPIEDIQSILRSLRPAPGRMELYRHGLSPHVVVDYAHTPDALEKALLSVKRHCEGDVWCVFGCGGDRDRAKRAVMGAAADQYAEHVIITNDNPRSEAGDAIAADIAKGIHGSYVVVLDRATAIAQAIESAAPEDWVLVAGKGHEATQQVGNDFLEFSDREQVSRLLEVDA